MWDRTPRVPRPPPQRWIFRDWSSVGRRIEVSWREGMVDNADDDDNDWDSADSRSAQYLRASSSRS